jgi:hypothetical protein
VENSEETSSTIESLEGTNWPGPEFASHLVTKAHALRKKPIAQLTPEDLRMAFNEDIGTRFLKERVLQILNATPQSAISTMAICSSPF